MDNRIFIVPKENLKEIQKKRDRKKGQDAISQIHEKLRGNENAEDKTKRIRKTNSNKLQIKLSSIND